MNLSLSKLHHVAVVAEKGSLSRAAEELNLTQPALSRSIASVEDRYAVRIFDRTRSGMTLTSSGAELIAHVAQLLRHARTLDHNLRLHARGEQGRIAIGIAPLLSSIVLPELARHFFETRPCVTMLTLIRPIDVLVDALLREEVDLLLGPGPIESAPEIEIVEMKARISAAFIVRASHPLAGSKSVPLNDVLKFPLACSVEISWAKRPESVSGAFICDNFHIIADVVRTTDMVWVCPRQFAADGITSGEFSVLTVPNTPLSTRASPFAVTQLVLGTLKGRTLSPLQSDVTTFLKDYFLSRPLMA